MVKFTVWNEANNCENTKFTREFNTYGFDENGIGEELLFPILQNDGVETNLAIYLVKTKRFDKTSVQISKTTDKDGVKIERIFKIILNSENNFMETKLNNFKRTGKGLVHR